MARDGTAKDVMSLRMEKRGMHACIVVPLTTTNGRVKRTEWEGELEFSESHGSNQLRQPDSERPTAQTMSQLSIPQPHAQTCRRIVKSPADHGLAFGFIASLQAAALYHCRMSRMLFCSTDASIMMNDVKITGSQRTHRPLSSKNTGSTSPQKAVYNL